MHLYPEVSKTLLDILRARQGFSGCQAYSQNVQDIEIRAYSASAGYTVIWRPGNYSVPIMSGREPRTKDAEESEYCEKHFSELADDLAGDG